MDQEAEATYFAACLLVPRLLVIAECGETCPNLADDRLLKRLAARFQVPIGILVWRLVEIYGEPKFKIT